MGLDPRVLDLLGNSIALNTTATVRREDGQHSDPGLLSSAHMALHTACISCLQIWALVLKLWLFAARHLAALLSLHATCPAAFGLLGLLLPELSMTEPGSCESSILMLRLSLWLWMGDSSFNGRMVSSVTLDR